MNIGIDLRTLQEKHRTGVGEYTFNLLQAVLKLDQSNRYFLFTNSIKPLKNQNFSQPNTTFVHTRYPNKLFNFLIYLRILKIDKFLPEKIDCWYSPNLNFTSLSKTTKHILVIHDLSYEFYPEFYTFKQRLWHYFLNPKKLCSEADVIIVPSENTKRDLIKYYQINTDKIQIVNPSISPNFKLDSKTLEIQKSLLKKKYDLPDNFILFLGSIEPRKNLNCLIRAYEKLPENLTKKYHLIIAGATGWKNYSIYNFANKSKLKHRIKFLGYLKDEDKPALYSLSDIFIFPSIYEGFGMPILEAMQMGVPIISSNRSSLNEVAKNSALLINPTSIQSLTCGMQSLLSNNDLRNIYKKRGLEMASKFSSEKSAEIWLRIINSLKVGDQIEKIGKI